MSRKDLGTQLWAIENVVQRDDSAGAVTHCDIALRVSRNASDLLFPILTSAMSDPPTRVALLRTLSRRPIRGAAFVEYAADNSSDARTTAQPLEELHNAGAPVSGTSQLLLINALISRWMADES